MHVAIPANLRVGLNNITPKIEERLLPADEAINKLDAGSTLFKDICEQLSAKYLDYSILYSFSLSKPHR